MLFSIIIVVLLLKNVGGEVTGFTWPSFVAGGSGTRPTGCWKARALCVAHRMPASSRQRCCLVGVASVFTFVTGR